jgi:hypothetical protein
MPLAICEPAEGFTRLLGIVVPPILLVAWLVALALLWRSSTPRARPWVVGVFAISVVLGLAILAPNGFSDSEGTDYGTRFLVSVGVSAALGVLLSLRAPDAGPARLGLAGILGDITIPGLLVLLLAFTLSVGNGCLG